MDGQNTISPQSLYATIGTAASPLVIDVQRDVAFDAGESMLVSALRRVPEEVGKWRSKIRPDCPVVVYCVHGHEVSRQVTAALRGAGLDARYLEGGLTGWAELGLPLRKKVSIGSGSWVTRERPKPHSFLRQPSGFFDMAATTGATAYDIPGAEPFSHDGELCSFDAFLRVYEIRDAALNALAIIVRGADTARLDLAPQAAGLLALSLGLCANFPDDHAMLEHGMVMYDAFYAWCRSYQGETHNWTPGRAR
jgi:rhodanese-related sulfurtransferase